MHQFGRWHRLHLTSLHIIAKEVWEEKTETISNLR
jgi:hypothetical protein